MSKGKSGLFKNTIGARIATASIRPRLNKQVASLSAESIRFSQTSVNDSKEVIESMKKHGWVGDPIDVVTMEDGKTTTLDNTRVVAARIADIRVKARVHDYDEPIISVETARRFSTPKNGTPQTWGEAVDYRIAKQNSTFRKNSAHGSYTMNRIN